MMLEVRDDLHKDAEALGLNIQDVRIRRTDLTREVSPKTYDRMRAERLAEAELLRAQGGEEGQRRRAIADRQVVEITAEAQRDSEILRGEGDAERNRLFADAFNKNPNFFEFYRSMAAYTTALSSQDTTLVLSPNRSSSATSTARPACRVASRRLRSTCLRLPPLHRRTDRAIRFENIGAGILPAPFISGGRVAIRRLRRSHADCTGFREKVISPSIITPYAHGQSALLTT
jgi:hypothetical protein